MRNSVAMCTYNGATWLREQLASIASQTCPPDELVVCDDRSNDSTVAIIRSFASSAPFPVRLHVNEVNLGPTANFGRAIGLCDGDIIFLSDQDDVWLPTKIARMAPLLEQSPGVGAVFGDGHVADAEMQPLGYTLWQATRFTPEEQEKVLARRTVEVLLKHHVVHGATMAFRAEMRTLTLPIPVVPWSGHDSWTALLIAAVADYALVREPVIRYRLHSGNVTGIRRRSLREQIALGRNLVRGEIFRHEADVLNAACDRLLSMKEAPNGRPAANAVALIRDKVAYLQARDRMSASFIRRLPDVLRENARGGYFKYGQGWRSIAQDVFLRG